MRDWAKDYVDLESRYLPEEDYARIEGALPIECPTCEGARFYIAPSGIRLDCDCRQQKALFKHYLAAGIGELYMRLSWSEWSGTSQSLTNTDTWLQNWRGFLSQGVGVIYVGGYGTGKTMLAALTAKELVKLGQDVWFTTYSAMIETFAAGWKDRDEQRRFERKVVGSKVLVLDDIGKEMITKLSESTFDHVLRQRVVALRPTLITTNISEKEIEGRYGGAALSLIGERSMWIATDGVADFRPAARSRAQDEIVHGWRRPIT